MFFNVSETKTAQEALEAAVGPVGRCLYSETENYTNISLWTKNLGKIWYGDLAISELGLIREIAKQLHESIYLLPEWSSDDATLFNRKRGLAWQYSAVQELSSA